MELKGIRGVVVLAAAGLEASVMVGTGGLSTVCNDCLRNCSEMGNTPGAVSKLSCVFTQTVSTELSERNVT